ncbi:hypothetical protein ACIQPP_19575 [Streptomyces violaceusniger]|uniref:hypothetical protein n=1 Tax=Streptomyces violaceusniger TaxID=68280 RepID=UPI0009980DCB|nr:hypothetical protein [Streptomyces hygroscopicus]AQW50724.1 Di-and tricarboxylate transporter [Streptomyces hygroscopicus]
MADILKLCSTPPGPLPERGLLVTARPAAWQALGVALATAAAVFAPIAAPAAPALYVLCAVRLRRVRL